MSTLGQQIGDRRRALGMTQQTLGAAVDRSQGQICQYETGYRGIRLGTLLAIADALGCDVRLVPRGGADNALADVAELRLEIAIGWWEMDIPGQQQALARLDRIEQALRGAA